MEIDDRHKDGRGRTSCLGFDCVDHEEESIKEEEFEFV